MIRAVTLSQQADDFVETQIASGDYPSADAVLEAALQHFRAHRSRAPLDALLQSALADVDQNGTVTLAEVMRDMDEAITPAR